MLRSTLTQLKSAAKFEQCTNAVVQTRNLVEACIIIK